MEEWKTIRGYEGLYQVSNEGRVKSFKNPKNPKILKPNKTKFGYLTVALIKDGIRCTKSIHRLVAEAFIPNEEGKPHIDHINTIRDDNNVTNLRWCTREENQNNPITREKLRQAAKLKGEKSSKIVLVYDREFNLLSAFTSTAQAAKQLELSQGNIANCCMGSLSTYKDMYFSYIPLSSIEDRQKVERKALPKFKKRMKSLAKAQRKYYFKDVERSREIGRQQYYKRKEQHKWQVDV